MKHPSTTSCSRRSFLHGCGLTLSGFGVASLFPTPFIRHALASTASSNRRLMFIFLRGGNDGINTLIPHGDTDYSATNRSTLYIPPAQAIDLNGFASFHPGLADMMEVFNAGEMAVVHRAGFAESTLSHFVNQRIWENGTPALSGSLSGWLAKTIFTNNFRDGSDLPALSAQPSQPVLLRGTETYLNVADAGNFNFSLPFLTEPLKSKVIDSWPPNYTSLHGLEPYGPILKQNNLQLISFVDEFETWDQANWDPKDPDNPTWSLFPVSFATNPDDPAGPNGKKFSAESYEFFQNIKVCALSLLQSNPLLNTNGTRVAGTEMNGFDTHGGQGSIFGRQRELLEWLAYGFRSLRIALSGAAIDPRDYASVWDKTIISTMSEFGRTSIAPRNGTDHGLASCLWLQGGSINGGVYNCDSSAWPQGSMFSGSSADSGARYLAHLTDYRAIFWEIMRDHMGAAPATLESVFPGYTAAGLAGQELGLFSGL